MAYRQSVWVVIPYAGESQLRLDVTVISAWEARPAGVRVEHCGSLPTNMNHGRAVLKLEGATHICWLSTGDTLHPDRFKHPLPTDKAQCCLVDVEREGGNMILPRLDEDWQRLMYTDNQICGSGIVVPVGVWDDVGGFCESLTYCSDWEFAVRVQSECGWECVPKILAYAHEYPGGLTRGADPTLRARDRARVAWWANYLRPHGARATPA